MASHRTYEKGEKGPSWFAIVLMLMIFPPVGVFLLISKILANVGANAGDVGTGEYRTYDDRSRRRRDRYDERAARRDAGAAPERPERKTEERPGFRVSGVLRLIGALLLGLGAVIFLPTLLGGLISGSAEASLGAIVGASAFGLSGAGLLFAAQFIQKRVERYNRYIVLLAASPVASIDVLAASIPTTYKRACRDLQDMINRGYFPDGYVDFVNRRFICSVKANPPGACAGETEGERPAQTEFEAILAQIRAANALIRDETVSRQIDRIETLTRRIFEVVQKQPEKLPQIRTFMNYYLPVTLKLLDAYGQLERQDVEGGNIAEARNSIERIMETLVSGFERQLDRLFAEDVLDISSDIRVLETMLGQDGFKPSDFPVGTQRASEPARPSAPPAPGASGGETAAQTAFDGGAATQAAPEKRD
ncbi:MAG TPA: 5-bromo-4-chloroindolyl phosphate hydrolysis family protein [Oscillospiraceae bacterium]|nr:5-bromo-4-chloroindolyl phosphate hydrolysis family protein [Oscillospiraceae bacterium]